MIDVNKPVTNPELINIIHALKENFTPEVEKDFLRLMKTAHFLSPVIIDKVSTPDENGVTTLEKNTTIKFITLEIADNQLFLPVFTDWIELRKWRNIANEQTLITTYDDLCTMVEKTAAHAGFVINPCGESILITRDLIEQFNNPQPLQSYTVKEDTQVKIGIPADYPKAMTNAISKYLKSQKNVKSAYLVLMEKEGEQSFLIAVDFTRNRQITFNGIASAATPHLKKEQFIDMVSLDSGIGINISSKYSPFYRRKTFGLF